MSPSLANFLFELVNLLLLAGGLGWVLFKPARRALDSERERRSAEQAEAEKARADALATKAAAEELAQRLHSEAEDRERELLEASKKDASKLLADARADIEKERRALVAELQAARESSAIESAELVGRIAAGAVRDLLEAIEGPALDEALVLRAIPELERLGSRGREPLSIETARPLTPKSKQALAALLGAVQERVVPELGAGVRVTTRGGQVDATAAALARQAAEALKLSLTPSWEMEQVPERTLAERLAGVTLDLTPALIPHGTVSRVADGVAQVSGLMDVGADELVALDSGGVGMAYELGIESAGVVLLSGADAVRVGDGVRGLGRLPSIPVGSDLLGRVVDPLGRALDGRSAPGGRPAPVFAEAPSLSQRAPVTEPLHTGVMVIDSAIPIGRGQRQLIVGDRNVGKTALALDLVAAQRTTGVLCVYVTIGQPVSRGWGSEKRWMRKLR